MNPDITKTSPDDKANLPTQSWGAVPPGQDPPTITFHGEADMPGGDDTPPGYRIIKELGRGGGGVVYHAIQESLNRPVALKLLGTERLTDKRMVIRFLAEAEATASIQHRNVVAVHDYGEHRGRPYMALEYCPGGSLAERLKQSPPLNNLEAAELVAKLAKAVHAAHAFGIVHRDLKPANVLFDAAGEPKISDFGLAKRNTNLDLTTTNAIMGTPAYMAPEQARGDNHYVSPTTDVWALGVILYESLSGTRPFIAENTHTLLMKVIETEPKSLTNVPRDLATICFKCLSKQQADRYPTALKLAEDLERYRVGKPVTARPASFSERFDKWIRRNPLPTALVASLLAGVIATTVLAVRSNSEAHRADNAAILANNNAKLAGENAQKAEKAAEEAKEKERTTRKLLANIATQEGLRLVEEGENRKAALWFVEALKRNPDDEEFVKATRLRLGNLFIGDIAPRLVHTFVVPPKEHVAGYSDNGLKIFTQLGKDKLRVYDTETGQMSCQVNLPNIEGYNCLLSPDGELLSVRNTVDGANFIRVIDTKTGKELFTPVAGKPYASAHFSPDGRTIEVSIDNAITLLDARTGKAIVPLLKNFENTFTQFSADGKLYLILQKDGLRILDTVKGKEICPKLSAKNVQPLPELNINSTGTCLAFKEKGKPIQIFSIPSGESEVIPNTETTLGLVFNQDGDTIAFRDKEKVFQLYDVNTKTMHKAAVYNDKTISPEIWSSPMQNYYVASDIWGVNTIIDPMMLNFDFDGNGEHLHLERRAAGDFSGFDPTAELILLRRPDYSFKILSVESIQPLWGHTNSISSILPIRNSRLKYHPECHRLTSISNARVIQIWQHVLPPQTQTEKRFAPSAPADESQSDINAKYVNEEFLFVRKSARGWCEIVDINGQRRGRPLGIDFDKNYPVFSENGKYLIGIQRKHYARTWDAKTGEPLGPYLKHPHPIDNLICTPDGKYMMTEIKDDGLRFWEVSTGRLLRHIEYQNIPQEDRFNQLDVSPTGRYFLTVGYNRKAKAYNPVNGADLGGSYLVDSLDDRPVQLAIIHTKDGDRIVSNDRDATKIIEPVTGQYLGTIRDSQHNHVAFTNPAGTVLFMPYQNNFLRMYDLATLKPFGEPLRCTTNSGYHKGYRFSPDGKLLLLQLETNALRVYDTSTGLTLTPVIYTYGLISDFGFANNATEIRYCTQYEQVTISLKTDTRNVEDLTQDAELQASSKIDANGTLIPLTEEELLERFNTVKAKDPARLTATNAEKVAWHAHHLLHSHYDVKLFHINALKKLEPTNPEWQRQKMYALEKKPPLELAPRPRSQK